MAGGFKMEFVADVAKFLRGTKDVERALDDVSGSLDDLARDAQKSADKTGDAFDDAGRKIGDDVEDGAKDAGKSLERVGDDAKDSAKEVDTAAEKMERSFRDAFDGARGESKRVGDDVSTNTRRGFDDAGKATETFKQEAKQNLSETISSFRGDAEDIPQIFQDMFGGVVSDLGPAGLVGSALAAAGIGLAVALFQQSAEEAEALKEKVIDLADQIREADGDVKALDWGQIFRDFGNEISDAKSWFEPWQDAAKTNYETIKAYADKAGVDYSRLFQGMAGDTDIAKVALADLDDQIAAADGQIENYVARTQDATDNSRAWTTAEAEGLTTLQDKRDGLQKIRDELKENSGLTDEAIEYEKLMAEAYKGSAAEARDLNDALKEKADLTGDAITSELDYLDAITGTTAKIAENGATVDKNTEQGRNNLRALSDLKDNILGYADATEEATGNTAEANAIIAKGRDEFIRQATAAGMSEQAAKEYADQLGLIPRHVPTDVDLNVSKAERDLANFLANARSQQIRIQARVDADPNYNPATAPSQIRRARGGIIPGMPSSTDNLRADVASGEYVVNADATAKNRQLLDAINQGRQPVLPAGQTGPTTVSLEGANITLNVDGASFRAYVDEVATGAAENVSRRNIREAQARRQTRGRSR